MDSEAFMPASPHLSASGMAAKRHFDMLSSSPTARKRARQDTSISSASTVASPSLGNTPLADLNEPQDFQSFDGVLLPMHDGDGGSNEEEVINLSPTGSLSASTNNFSKEYQALENATHATRIALQDEIRDGNGTSKKYITQTDVFFIWWKSDQERKRREDPSHHCIPSEPITATKVAFYLDYKRKWPKCNGQKGTVGVSSIKGTISALENWCLNHQHEPTYKAVAESQVSLRLDVHIRQMESAAAAGYHTHVAESQTCKAAGASSDTYTKDELIQCSMWYLTSCGSTQWQLYLATRNRAMLLLSTCTAFRGDNICSLLWSDLFLRNVPMPALGLDRTTTALVCLVDQGKTNTNGRLDEHGAFRHRYTELCAIGALGMMFFTHFHVLKRQPPVFEPDFDDPVFGQYGRCYWYQQLVFPSTKDETKEMAYQTHAKHIKTMHEENNISSSKVTHIGRPQFAITAREFGAAIDETKAGGGWSEQGSFRACYDRAIPVATLLGAAMFDARRPEQHCLPWEHLQPPRNLTDELFPFAESALDRLHHRRKEFGTLADDFALDQFCKLLIGLRCIIIQDAAVLYATYPTCPLFKQAPFNTPIFTAFALSSIRNIRDAEENARHRLALLPEQVAASIQGLHMTTSMKMERERLERCRQHSKLLTALKESRMSIPPVPATGRQSRKRKVTDQYHETTSSLLVPTITLSDMPPSGNASLLSVNYCGPYKPKLSRSSQT